MKTSNKLLTGGLVFLLFIISVAIGGLSYLAVKGNSSFIVFEYEPIVIDRQTSREGLDSLQKATKETGGDLEFSKTVYDAKGELHQVAGNVAYPCCSASFETDSLINVAFGKGIGGINVWVNQEDFQIRAWD